MSVASSFKSATGDGWDFPTIKDRFLSYMDPFFIYRVALYTLLEVIFETLRSDPRALLSFSSVRDDAFGKTWLKISGNDPRDGPLFDFAPLLGSATGVVLEVGPGSGVQVKSLTSSRIKAVYGAEPCELLHEHLKAAASNAGLAAKYHVLDCGGQRKSLIPQLQRAGLLGSNSGPVFDTIICSKVLCSIPDLEDTVACLYDLLKPGGRMLVLEHVKNPWRTRKGDLVSRMIQILIMLLGWTFVMGGCHLNRETSRVLKSVACKDGGWQKEDLEAKLTFSTIPWVMGELVKKSIEGH
ncbi:MAG: hypothetical protein M1818_001098 [Claussenomyces sp. TS43310]|nr:MAG: hypothetical protein M1818_001098 [Claussenomyces sp. TS43310]